MGKEVGKRPFTEPGPVPGTPRYLFHTCYLMITGLEGSRIPNHLKVNQDLKVTFPKPHSQIFGETRV